MNRKKTVLIFAHTSHLAHVGGPLGYLNNLKKQLDKNEIKSVHFIEDGAYRPPKKRKFKRIRKVLYPLKRAYLFNKMLSKSQRSKLIENCQDDYIHFHYTGDLFKYRESLKEYKGKVILTSHSPILTSKEISSSLSTFEKRCFKKIYSRLLKMDVYAFEHADYIIFPCKEAEEPYLHSWDQFSEFKSRNDKKFKYLLTGIDRYKASKNKTKIRKEYHIPINAFCATFVGRHNEIKGYTNLKKIGKKILESDNNCYFLNAGIEKPIKGLGNNRWIEVGWTNDPYSIINASDVFILPNKETYFDLIFLEVLSLGKTIIASKTGGNKYFERFQNSGIYLYESDQECIEILKRLKKRTPEQVENDEKANLKIYKENFTSEIFMKNYVKLINKLN